MSMKNPLTLAGIEPATFRFVTQHLNHCATAVPHPMLIVVEIAMIQWISCCVLSYFISFGVCSCVCFLDVGGWLPKHVGGFK